MQFATDDSISGHAQFVRDALEAHARAGREIVQLPARSVFFLRVVKAALALPGAPLPLVLLDWQGDEGELPTSLTEGGIGEAACDRMGVTG